MGEDRGKERGIDGLTDKKDREEATRIHRESGLYAGPNYCQSHMFWWTHGC